ncbi:MAG: cytochrome c [Acidobacteria bacterium]|nr:cytochrome c [Acidobacteriota bacterium]
MKIPPIVRIGVLVLATTGFYTYVGQMVPQSEVHPPEETVMRTDLTTAEMVTIGREIMDGKGLCFTCHTIGQTGALRFPDLEGIGARAADRIPGMSDVEYLAQSLYEPDVYIVEGFNPGMPPAHRPPIGLTDEEILSVIAFLQSLGGTPTVTLETTHRYRGAPATPDTAPPPDDPPSPGEALPLIRKGALLTPGDHHPPARLVRAARLADQPPLKLRPSAGALARAEARDGEGGGAR